MLGMWVLSFYDDICVVMTFRSVSEPPPPPLTGDRKEEGAAMIFLPFPSGPIKLSHSGFPHRAKTGGSFSDFHSENLVWLLQVNPKKVWGDNPQSF